MPLIRCCLLFSSIPCEAGEGLLAGRFGKREFIAIDPLFSMVSGMVLHDWVAGRRWRGKRRGSAPSAPFPVPGGPGVHQYGVRCRGRFFVVTTVSRCTSSTVTWRRKQNRRSHAQPVDTTSNIVQVSQSPHSFRPARRHESACKHMPSRYGSVTKTSGGRNRGTFPKPTRFSAGPSPHDGPQLFVTAP